MASKPFAEALRPVSIEISQRVSAAMKYTTALFCFLLAAGATLGRAQVAPSATARQFGLSAGGLGSFFQPDYGPNRLFGVGAFVDLKFTRWVQLEGEGRWLRLNQYANIYEDNYVGGPRIPIHRFWRATPYAKVLVGLGVQNFQYNIAHGHFTDIAYGGGVDIRLSRRWTVRAVDFEYQQWPNWVSGTLSPYGVSAGMSYQIFGGAR
jgi:hypothetical protein